MNEKSIWRPLPGVVQWRDKCDKWSRQTGVPTELLLAVIHQESGGRNGLSRYEPDYMNKYCGPGSKGQMIAAKCRFTLREVATSYGIMQLMRPLS